MLVTASAFAAPESDTCFGQRPGDANSDGALDAGDIGFLLDFINSGGPEPNPQSNGDSDGDCCIDIYDVMYLYESIFHYGPPPVSCTCVNPPLCDSCSHQHPGDLDRNGGIDISDIVVYVQYLWRGGASPAILANGDANGDCLIDTMDAHVVIVAIFEGGTSPVACSCIRPRTRFAVPSDANNSGAVNLADVVAIIDHVLLGGLIEPYQDRSGDPNCDCVVNISDAVYLIQYLFAGGRAPCSWEDWDKRCKPL
jgi:hypothetical protein